jgi:hypothetical protein
MDTTPGRKFFDQQLAYIGANDVEGLIDNQYAEDAVLISPFEMPGRTAPNIVRGHAALKDFFRAYLDWHGAISVESMYSFAETESSIFFQAIFTSQTGRWAVGDAWHMSGGKIGTHYSFAYRIS